MQNRNCNCDNKQLFWFKFAHPKGDIYIYAGVLVKWRQRVLWYDYNTATNYSTKHNILA